MELAQWRASFFWNSFELSSSQILLPDFGGVPGSRVCEADSLGFDGSELVQAGGECCYKCKPSLWWGGGGGGGGFSGAGGMCVKKTFLFQKTVRPRGTANGRSATEGNVVFAFRVKCGGVRIAKARRSEMVRSTPDRWWMESPEEWHTTSVH